jgi:hypothetical protein
MFFFASLTDGIGDLVGLTETHAHATLLVAHGDDRVEREAPAALDDLGATVHLDHALLELALGLLGFTRLTPLPLGTRHSAPPRS